MSSIYAIKNTSGDKTLTIKPGQINGAGGVVHDNDLKIHGYGSTQWGIGVNENFLRLIENFAVEQKESGDFDYDPSRLKPKDYKDLGLGLGINKPTIGQIWYNKTDNSLYVYVNDPDIGLIWKSISFKSGGDKPTSPNVGDMWFDIEHEIPTSCISTPVLKVYNPTHPKQDDGWVMVVDDAVKTCGDTMTGDLTIENSNIILTGTNSAIKIPNIPIDNEDGTNKLYVDAIGSGLSNHESDYSLHLTTEQNDLLDSLDLINPQQLADAINTLLNIPDTWDTFAEIEGKVDKSGDTMTGFLFLHSNPTLAMHAATKQYVDNATGASTGNSLRTVRYFNSLVPNGFPDALDGDIATVGGIGYMMISGVWRQVWPAQYSD